MKTPSKAFKPTQFRMLIPLRLSKVSHTTLVKWLKTKNPDDDCVITVADRADPAGRRPWGATARGSTRVKRGSKGVKGRVASQEDTGKEGVHLPREGDDPTPGE